MYACMYVCCFNVRVYVCPKAESWSILAIFIRPKLLSRGKINLHKPKNVLNDGILNPAKCVSNCNTS